MSKTIERIKRAYASCGLKVPIILASSPPVGAFLAPILAHADTVDDAVIRQAQRDAKKLAFEKPGSALIEKHKDALSHSMFGNRLLPHLRGEWDSPPGYIKNVKMQRMFRNLRDTEGAAVRVTQHNGIHGPIFRAATEHVRARIHRLFKRRVKYHDYFEAPEHIVCWPNKRFVVLSEKPERILLNNNRQLHSTEKLAVKFADGWGVAAINGIVIPTRYLHQRQTLTVKAINATANMEVRRALIELFGYERWLVESRATLICEDIDRDGHPRKLWGLESQNLPHWQVQRRLTGQVLNPYAETNMQQQRVWTLNLLEVFNSTPELDGTFKRYYLQVPGEIMTIQDALNWMADDSFGFDVAEPLIET